MRDSVYADGHEVYYKQWPDTPDGLIDDNGTVRPMTEAEVAEWHARNPPPPLVAPDERPDEDKVAATLALLAQDIIRLQATLQFAAANGRFPTAQEAVPLFARAEERTAELGTDDAVFRAMAAPRLAAIRAAKD